MNYSKKEKDYSATSSLPSIGVTSGWPSTMSSWLCKTEKEMMIVRHNTCSLYLSNSWFSCEVQRGATWRDRSAAEGWGWAGGWVHSSHSSTLAARGTSRLPVPSTAPSLSAPFDLRRPRLSWHTIRGRPSVTTSVVNSTHSGHFVGHRLK